MNSKDEFKQGTNIFVQPMRGVGECIRVRCPGSCGGDLVWYGAGGEMATVTLRVAGRRVVPLWKVAALFGVHGKWGMWLG